MAMQLYSEDEIADLVLAFFRGVFPDKDLSDKSFLGLTARAVAQSLVLIQAAVQRVDWDSPPAYQQDQDGTLRSRTSTEALDGWAFVFGLPSDVPGVYGRKGPLPATGGQGVPTGNVGTVFPAGLLLTDSTGQVTVRLNSTYVVPPGPGLAARFTTVTKGISGNLSAGSVLLWQSPPAGADPTVTLTGGLSRGKEAELDVELLERLLFRIQHPPQGGSAADYRSWAENAFDPTGASLGIDRAYIFPLRNGLGTVDVMPLLSGLGTARDPGAAIATQVAAFIDTLRPVTATVRVIRPIMPVAKALRLQVRVVPSLPTYAFDWNDGNGATTIQSARATELVVNFLEVPDALRQALLLGTTPRIQIISTSPGSGPLPLQRRVLQILDLIPFLGLSTLVVDAAMDPPPQAGDVFYADGPLVFPLAMRLQHFVDSLGPSRKSGYADKGDPWESKLTLARIADLILETRDSDGTQLVGTIPDLCNTGVRLAIGAGAFSAQDYEPDDLGGGCELAFFRDGGISILAG